MNLKALVQEKKLALVREFDVLKRKISAVEALSRLNDKTELELELFDLWDVGNEGHLSFEDLARGIVDMPQLSRYLSKEELAELRTKANDNKVDRTEFGHLLETLGQKTGGDFKDWVELLALIWQPSEHKIIRSAEHEVSLKPQEGSLEESVATAAHDGRMRNLFALFDADMDNKINFKDIAMSLRKIAPHVPLATASEAALKVLLDFDKDHDRMLDYMEFVHFISAFLRAGGLEFSQVADALVLAAARPDPSEEEIAQFDTVCASQNFSTFADYRLHKIFDLWDRDGDGLHFLQGALHGATQVRTHQALETDSRACSSASAAVTSQHLCGRS
eukprot:jgi/Botrbrau1/449/Bobra.110_2s0096.1